MDATHNTIAAVTNGGNRATDALLTLFYDGGKQKYEIQRSLAAGEQMWLNFGDLIRNQAPGRNGKVLPINLTSGTYELRDLNPGRNHGGNLFEGKVIVDKTWGHLTYGCMICCGYNSPWYDPGSMGLAIGSSDQPTTWATDGCSGYSQPISDFATSWWTNSTAIATVSQGVVTRVGVGSTRNYGRGPLQGGDGRDIGRYRQCHMPTTTASNTVAVQMPHHLEAVNDTTAALAACPATKIRKINYQVVDVSNNSIAGAVSIREQFTTKSMNSCNTPVSTTETCTLTNSGFEDDLSVGCNSAGGSCGFTYTHQQWLWCPQNGGASGVIATPGDLVVHNDLITVGGNVLGFTPGTFIFP